MFLVHIVLLTLCSNAASAFSAFQIFVSVFVVKQAGYRKPGRGWGGEGEAEEGHGMCFGTEQGIATWHSYRKASFLGLVSDFLMVWCLCFLGWPDDVSLRGRRLRPAMAGSSASSHLLCALQVSPGC